MTSAAPPFNWRALPDDAKVSLIKTVIRQSREAAANSVMMESLGGPNDIVRQATELKRAMMADAQAKALPQPSGQPRARAIASNGIPEPTADAV